MILPELAGHFVARSVAVALGTDLFLGGLPDAPDTCAALFEAVALPPVEAFEGVLWERTQVQVLARGVDFAAGRQLAEKYYRAAVDATNLTLSGVRYLQMEPIAPPVLVDRDGHGRPLFSLNLVVWKEPS